MTKNILDDIGLYYNSKIQKFGASPEGVDWNSGQSQILRFSILANIIQPFTDFNIADLGCGYGALLQYLNTKYADFSYHGFDISHEMLVEAKKLFLASRHAHWHKSAKLYPESYDFVIASGIFNVKLNATQKEWHDYILDTLNMMHESSNAGFAFNCLTSYSDSHLMRNDLYYANPLEIFDYCKKMFSRNVSLIHDYDLYEFTILVRKYV